MKPILFNTEMVRAILDGRKTVTRRVVKPQPKYATMTQAGLLTSDSPITLENGLVVTECGSVTTRDKLPYRPGDILYARETWAKFVDGHYLYRAWAWPGNEPEKEDEAMKALGLKWRPSIHMPKEAARLFLRVKDVRVERLRPMGLDDFEAEGLNTIAGLFETTAKFADLWDSTINPTGLDIFGWEANPWVWVIEFERITKEVAEHG